MNLLDLQNLRDSRICYYDAESEVKDCSYSFYNLNLDIGLFLHTFRSAYITSSNGSCHFSVFCGFRLNYLK